MRRNLIETVADSLRLRRMLSDLPNESTLRAREVGGVLNVYRKLYTAASALCYRMIGDLDTERMYSDQVSRVATLTIHYLAERVVVTPFHVVNLITRDPKYAHSDIAALNRGLFESAANAAFLMTGDTDMRFRQFWLTSLKHELRLQKSMDKWVEAPDEETRRRARHQAGIKDATIDELVEELRGVLGEVGAYPSIRSRCEALGQDWEFYYDSKYRGLSSWQHGDVSRAFVTQAMEQIAPDQAERAVFESLGQCGWAWDIVFLYATSLHGVSGTPDVGAEITRLNAVGYSAMMRYVSAAAKKFQGDAA